MESSSRRKSIKCTHGPTIFQLISQSLLVAWRAKEEQVEPCWAAPELEPQCLGNQHMESESPHHPPSLAQVCLRPRLAQALSQPPQDTSADELFAQPTLPSPIPLEQLSAWERPGLPNLVEDLEGRWNPNPVAMQANKREAAKLEAIPNCRNCPWYRFEPSTSRIPSVLRPETKKFQHPEQEEGVFWIVC